MIEINQISLKPKKGFAWINKEKTKLPKIVCRNAYSRDFTVYGIIMLSWLIISLKVHKPCWTYVDFYAWKDHLL